MSDLDRLGERVARRQDAQLAERAHELARVRSRLLAEAAPRRGRVVALVGALAAAAVLVLWLAARGPDLSYEIGGIPGTAALGVPVGGAEDRDATLRFSDGSTVLLHAGAVARVAQAGSRGAHVVIERGLAAISVPRRHDTTWRFDVGPFVVQVTGTRFNVEWRAARSQFRIEMQDGSVIVTGPVLDGPTAVVAGQTLEVLVGEGVVHRGSVSEVAAPAGPAAAPSAAVAVAPAVVAAPSASGVGAPGPVLVVVDAGASSSDWRSLARRGDYRAAYAATEVSGVDAVIAGASAEDLLLLGDTARFAGHSDVARRAYQAVRDRFGGSRSAGVAAFSLGRLGGAGALAWFEAYLREEPSGSLAREALGRVMELHHAAKNDVAARAAAERYLARYAGGPHSALAQALVDAGRAAGDAGSTPR